MALLKWIVVTFFLAYDNEDNVILVEDLEHADD